MAAPIDVEAAVFEPSPPKRSFARILLFGSGAAVLAVYGFKAGWVTPVSTVPAERTSVDVTPDVEAGPFQTDDGLTRGGPGDAVESSHSSALAMCEAQLAAQDPLDGGNGGDVRCVPVAAFRFSQREVAGEMSVARFGEGIEEASIRIIVESMQEDGWNFALEPPTAVIRQTESGTTYHTFDNRRVWSASVAGLEYIPCTVLDPARPASTELPMKKRYGVRFCRAAMCHADWDLRTPMCHAEGLGSKDVVPIQDIPLKYPLTQGDVLAFRSFSTEDLEGAADLPRIRGGDRLPEIEQAYFRKVLGESWLSPTGAPWFHDGESTSVATSADFECSAEDSPVIGCWQWNLDNWAQCKFFAARSAESSVEAAQLAALVSNAPTHVVHGRRQERVLESIDHKGRTITMLPATLPGLD